MNKRKLILVLLFCVVSIAKTQTGFIVDAGTSTGTYSHTNISKVWYTDGFWWCIADDGSGSDWFIYKGDATAPSPATEGGWTITSNNIDTRGSTIVDIFWDESTQTLHAIHIHGTAYYTEWDYNSGTDVYTKNSTIGNFAIDGSAELGTEFDSGANASIAVDSSEQVWIAFTEPTGGFVMGFSDNAAHTSFDTTRIDLAAIDGDRVSIIPFVLSGGNNAIGVAWSLNNGATGDFMFSWHQDVDANTTWSTETIDGTPSGGADDHVNIKSYNGDLFVSAKSNSTNILFYKRPSGSVWSSSIIIANAGSRPQVIIDETNNEVYVFQSNTDADDKIVYRKSDIGTISFGSQVIVMGNTSNDLLQVSTAKHNVTGVTDLRITAVNNQTGDVWWGEVDITNVVEVTTRQRIWR